MADNLLGTEKSMMRESWSCSRLHNSRVRHLTVGSGAHDERDRVWINCRMCRRARSSVDEKLSEEEWQSSAWEMLVHQGNFAHQEKDET